MRDDDRTVAVQKAEDADETVVVAKPSPAGSATGDETIVVLHQAGETDTDATVAVAQKAQNADADATIAVQLPGVVGTDATVVVAKSRGFGESRMPAGVISPPPGTPLPAAPRQVEMRALPQVSPLVNRQLMVVDMPERTGLEPSVRKAVVRRGILGWCGFVACCLATIIGVSAMVTVLLNG